MRGLLTDSGPRVGVLTGLVCVLSAGCTYAPPEERTEIVQTVGIPNSYDAWVVTRIERFRRPTGLSAFPDGGRWRFIRREGVLNRIDARARTSTVLARWPAPDRLWESFAVHVRGLEGDSVAYVVTTGCPRGGECHPELMNGETFRVSREGEVESVSDVPPDAGLPGVMLAPRPGERRYVRLGVAGDTLRGRFEVGVPYEPLFRLSADGGLRTIGE